MTSFVLVLDLLEGPAIAAAIAVKLGSLLVLWPPTAYLIFLPLLFVLHIEGRDAKAFLFSTVHLEALFFGDIELLAKVEVGDWLFGCARLVPLAWSFLE